MIKSPARRAFIKKSLTLLSSLSLYSCGGGGGSGSMSTTTTLPTVLPSFLLQPSDQSIRLGETATFQALANGSGPLSYQWQRNGSSITGATSLTYTTPPAMLGDSALFSVLVTNDAGTVSSRDAQLTVAALPVSSSITVDSVTVTVDSTMLTVDSA